MAELLVRIRNHTAGGVIVAGRLRRGEVISVFADDHEWSAAEQDNPDWRVVKLPGVPVGIIERVLTRLTDMEEAAISQGDIEEKDIPDRRRAWRFNLSVLQSFLNDADAVAAFRADPSFRALVDLGVIERWDAA
jgi:hypothetical protein